MAARLIQESDIKWWLTQVYVYLIERVSQPRRESEKAHERSQRERERGKWREQQIKGTEKEEKPWRGEQEKEDRIEDAREGERTGNNRWERVRNVGGRTAIEGNTSGPKNRRMPRLLRVSFYAPRYFSVQVREMKIYHSENDFISANVGFRAQKSRLHP